VTDQLHFSQAGLSTHLKDPEKLRQSVAINSANLGRKRVRIVTNPLVERALLLRAFDWLKKGNVLSYKILESMRKRIEVLMEVEKPMTKTGWIQSFCSACVLLRRALRGAQSLRYGLKSVKAHGEAASCDPEKVVAERARCQEMIRKAIEEEGYTLEDIYNADESAFYIECVVALGTRPS
jgi:hypothetical protein